MYLFSFRKIVDQLLEVSRKKRNGRKLVLRHDEQWIEW